MSEKAKYILASIYIAGFVAALFAMAIFLKENNFWITIVVAILWPLFFLPLILGFDGHDT